MKKTNQSRNVSVDEADIQSFVKEGEEYVLKLIASRAGTIQRSIQMNEKHSLNMYLESLNILHQAWLRIRLQDETQE